MRFLAFGTGRKPDGYEIRPTDVGTPLYPGWGLVLPADVGKRFWVKPYGLTMENSKQRDARKKKG